jgi:hypothetical protein
VRRRGLESVALRVAGWLGKEDCVLVGGLAVSAHGFVRATGDVDFVARVPLHEVKSRFESHGIPATLKRGSRLDGEFSFVMATVSGVRVDVLPELVPLDWSRAIELALTRTAALRVVDLEGLIRLKLRAGGPKDLMDVAALVLSHPQQEGRALELATAYGPARELEAWLRDPRLRRDLEAPAPPRMPRTPPASRRSPRRRRVPRRGTRRS